MKKKPAKQSNLEPLQEFRKSSAFPGFRLFFGVPFYVLAAVICSISSSWILATFADESIHNLFVATIIGTTFFVVMFILSIPALAGALFDIADAAIRADKRAADQAARDAYEAYRKNQASAGL
jgi:hypothetical protein